MRHLRVKNPVYIALILAVFMTFVPAYAADIYIKKDKETTADRLKQDKEKRENNPLVRPGTTSSKKPLNDITPPPAYIPPPTGATAQKKSEFCTGEEAKMIANIDRAILDFSKLSTMPNPVMTQEMLQWQQFFSNPANTPVVMDLYARCMKVVVQQRTGDVFSSLPKPDQTGVPTRYQDKSTTAKELQR